MVDWSKEIKLSDLRRKDQAEAEQVDETAPAPELVAEAPEPPPEAPTESAPEPEKTSLLKKEISFKRKPKEPKPAEETGPKAESASEKTSLLKKEISFKRKPKEPRPVEETRPEAEAEAEAASEKTSLLKKEISFKRKPKQPKTAAAGTEPKSAKKRAKRERPKLRRQSFGGGKRQKRVVGLKIGASQLAAARVHNNGAPELVQVARQDLDQGLIVGGELREPELLADALRSFFRKHRLPRQGVRLGIANNRIGVRIFEIAGIEDARQLENAIRFRAQEALPIPIEEAVLDYHVLGERVDEEGTVLRRVLLVVAYRELIDRYVAACKKAGIRLAGIDLEAFALLRVLAEPRAENEEAPADAALVVVAVGHDRSTFAVSDGRVCEFTRVLDWGGATLNVAIARELDLTPSEAEPFKRALSLVSQDVPEGLTREQAEAAREAVRRQLQTFARELVSSLQFYQNQPGSLGIGEIVITGGTAQLAGLAEELQRLIGVNVRVGDPLTRVKLGRKLRETEQLGSLAVAIGLGIED
jgi:type IV pilus assembly protein PilM